MTLISRILKGRYINKLLIIALQVIFSLLLYFNSSAQTYIPGNSYYGRNNYIEYLPGNLPLIISIPHGGALTPTEIPDRTCGKTVTDSYTTELGMEIRDAIFNETGYYPHLIINHLKRKKLDPNREVNEATCGNELANIAWNEFHDFIGSAKTIVKNCSGKGLLIDLHGHGHTIQRLELGYLLTATQLRNSDTNLDTPDNENTVSIRNLVSSNLTNSSLSELLRGFYSLGTMFEEKGFPSVPSIDNPYPLVGQSYFSGGYNTKTHGSLSEGTIDAIQIECNHDVRFVESNRLNFASNFAIIMLDYLSKHYFTDLRSHLSTNSAVESVIQIYPNPVRNQIYIHGLKSSEITIYNILGIIVYTAKMDIEGKIKLGNLENGIYIISISSGDKVLKRERIIINRK
ncbi:MAG: T9SS type A sorting domain-containing protein [Bacteroidales bacterium]|nr:T9SS type A sorting domain-containing protein [Bacteroidales bacterium]